MILSPGQSQQTEGQDGKDSKSSNPNNQRSRRDKPAWTQGRDSWEEGKEILASVSGYSEVIVLAAGVQVLQSVKPICEPNLMCDAKEMVNPLMTVDFLSYG